jgi:hypothetical protein
MLSVISANRSCVLFNSLFVVAWLGSAALAAGQSSISVVSSQGQTTVTWNGKQVYAGPTKGDVLARRFTVAGQEFAIAYDGGAVVWQNHTDAVTKLKSATYPSTTTHATSQGNVMCQTLSGIVRVTWNRKQVYSGSVKNPATVKSATIGGVAYAACYDGAKVVWESAPGAASKLK